MEAAPSFNPCMPSTFSITSIPPNSLDSEAAADQGYSSQFSTSADFAGLESYACNAGQEPSSEQRSLPPQRSPSPASVNYELKHKHLLEYCQHVLQSNNRLRNRIYHVRKEINQMKQLKRVLCERLLSHNGVIVDTNLEIPDDDEEVRPEVAHTHRHQGATNTPNSSSASIERGGSAQRQRRKRALAGGESEAPKRQRRRKTVGDEAKALQPTTSSPPSPNLPAESNPTDLAADVAANALFPNGTTERLGEQSMAEGQQQQEDLLTKEDKYPETNICSVPNMSLIDLPQQQQIFENDLSSGNADIVCASECYQSS